MDFTDRQVMVVSEEEAGVRLDELLFQRYEGHHSRSYFQHLIRDHLVLVNGEPVKKRVRPTAGDEVEIQFVVTPEIDVTPEEIPLDILYEDAQIIAVNKPAGMVVHPAPGHWSGTFVNALLFHCQGAVEGPDPVRPGIVHRLDKETSGALIAAKTLVAHRALVDLFAARRVYKEYLAICIGNPGTVTVDTLIGRHPVHRKEMTVLQERGRHAVTHLETLATSGNLSLVKVVLETGRTHQIRVHLRHLGCPLLGDSTYGSTQANKKYGAQRQMLHAYRLRLRHPISGDDLAIEAPLPQEMETLVNRLSS